MRGRKRYFKRLRRETGSICLAVVFALRVKKGNKVTIVLNTYLALSVIIKSGFKVCWWILKADGASIMHAVPFILLIIGNY